MLPSQDAVIDAERIDAVIFDLDGVVTDTADTHAMAWKRLFDEYLEELARQRGKLFQPFDADADYRRYVDGKPRYDGVESFLKSRGVVLPHGTPGDAPDQETVCGLGNRKNEYFLDQLKKQGVRAYPSSIEFIQRLSARGIRTAIISSSRNCSEVLEAAGVRGLFDVKVDGVDIAELGLRGKPDPAIFLEAARRLRVEPTRAVVVEDALAGVEAGCRGGFGLVVGVNRAGRGETLRKYGADVIVRDLAELQIYGAPTSPKIEAQKRAIRDLPSALNKKREITHRLARRKLAIFLDYDGTLTPIVDEPAQAVLSEETREVVKRLAARCPVAIISGRDLNDVQDMVGIGGIAYAGSHGFDIVGPDGSHRNQEHGQRFLPALEQAEAELRRSLEGIPGVYIERKRFTIAVHYRRVDEADVGKLEQQVNRIAEQQSELRKSTGKKIFELRPDIDWDKGEALLTLLEALSLDNASVVPLYIGDDVTDEDAFQAIRDGGIGIVVGEDGRQTVAHYSLQDPAEVRAFLETLVALAEGGFE